MTAKESALIAGVSPPTTSGHLGKLVDGRLLEVIVQGRYRYYRLADFRSPARSKGSWRYRAPIRRGGGVRHRPPPRRCGRRGLATTISPAGSASA